MKMTYAECLEMLNGLSAMDQVSPSILHVRLSYAVAKNKRKLNEVVKDMQTLLRQSEGFQKFQKEKKDILKKHAEKDSKGLPIKDKIQSPQGFIDDYLIKGGTEEGSPFARDLEKLKAKYKKEIDEWEIQAKKYNESLEMESDFEPHMVTEDLLPEKGIPQAAMNGLVYMITEETKPSSKKKTDKK